MRGGVWTSEVSPEGVAPAAHPVTGFNIRIDCESSKLQHVLGFQKFFAILCVYLHMYLPQVACTLIVWLWCHHGSFCQSMSALETRSRHPEVIDQHIRIITAPVQKLVHASAKSSDKSRQRASLKHSPQTVRRV